MGSFSLIKPASLVLAPVGSGPQLTKQYYGMRIVGPFPPPRRIVFPVGATSFAETNALSSGFQVWIFSTSTVLVLTCLSNLAGHLICRAEKKSNSNHLPYARQAGVVA